MIRSKQWARAFVLGIAVATIAGCGSDEGSGSSSTPPGVATPGVAVKTTMSPKRQQELAEIQAKLDAVKSLDAAGFAAMYDLPFQKDLGYDPLTAKRFDLVQASTLALNDAEKATLASNGFVIADRMKYPSFVYGYHAIYAADLPVYVSADSILFAVHQSFEAILKAVEEQSLISKLMSMLSAMRTSLTNGDANAFSAESRKDAEIYLAVAASLLSGSIVSSSEAATVSSLVAKANSATGAEGISLFGASRLYDFSQFTPRGHYTESEGLKRYFRSMMWLGRTDLRLIETNSDGSQSFQRRQVEGAYVLRALMSEQTRASWSAIDTTIGAFTGEPDNMTLPQLDSLLKDLQIANAPDLMKLTDQTIAQAIVNGDYGVQRIASQLMINGVGRGTLPLASSFMLLGQRYVLDSHVFSNVVYDRVQRGAAMRMMPNPLDVGFAALKNDQAGLLLGPEIERFAYAPDLASMRILADAHPAEFWEANLYNEWLMMLRAMSPQKSDVANPAAVGLPRITATEAWGRRILSTQLASWAELRHANVLYAKQAYTGIPGCEYPDAYVDPYPELYVRLAAYAARGGALLAGLSLEKPLADKIEAHFTAVRDVAQKLEAMAKNQRAGSPHSAEQIAWINGQIYQEPGCAGDVMFQNYDGWYARLFFEPNLAPKPNPIVTDVHTQPADEGGGSVGRVLHVGTVLPRTMVVTIDTCTGPQVFMGLVSSYREEVTQNFKRLTDEEWAPRAYQTTAPEVPWMAPIVVH